MKIIFDEESIRKFNIDEKAILISTQLYVAFALEALKKENKKHILISKIKEEKWN